MLERSVYCTVFNDKRTFFNVKAADFIKKAIVGILEWFE